MRLGGNMASSAGCPGTVRLRSITESVVVLSVVRVLESPVVRTVEVINVGIVTEVVVLSHRLPEVAVLAAVSVGSGKWVLEIKVCLRDGVKVVFSETRKFGNVKLLVIEGVSVI
jgi:hypothetical protein